MKLAKELLLLFLLFFVIDAEKDRDGEYDMRMDLSGTGYTVEDVLELGKKWVKGKTSFRILVVGKTGAGKSTLVNGLLGKEVAVTRNDFDSVTKITTGHHDNIGKIHVVVFDTPGLWDTKMGDDDIFKGIKTATGGDIDLLLYCIKMTETRFSEDDIQAIQRVTKALEKSVWEKGLFVLTLANHITESTMLGGGKGMKLDDYFNDTLLRWKTRLHKSMVDDIEISPEIAEKIPVVPAGYVEPKLPGNREHWISELWVQAFRRLDFPAMMALLVMSQGRITDSTDEIHKGSPEKQPLIMSHMSEDSYVIDPQWYPVIGSLVFGTLGNVVGNLILPGFGSTLGPLGVIAGEAFGNVAESYMTSGTPLPDQPETPLGFRTTVEKVLFPSLLRAFQKKLKLT